MLSGHMLLGQMSPWQLESVWDVTRNLHLKFHQNWVRNSWDIAGIEFLWVGWGGVVCKVIFKSNPTQGGIIFLVAQAPLELPHVKNENNKKNKEKVSNSNKHAIYWCHMYPLDTCYLKLVSLYLLPDTCFSINVTWHLLPDNCYLIHLAW